jgi:RHS repeat-associated protein
VGNQSVTQYDSAGNVLRELQFGTVGGPSPTSDGPDALPGPVSIGGVIQRANLVNSNLLAATEYLYDELGRQFQTDQVLFVNTIFLNRSSDVADGALDLGKEDLTPGDDQPIPGVGDIGIRGRVSTRSEFDRKSRQTFTVEDDGDTSRTFFDGADRVIKAIDPERNSIENAYDDNNNVIETRETDVSQVPAVADEVFLTTNFYDSLNRPQHVVNNIGQAMAYRYDSRNNQVAMADALGPMTGATITRRAFPNGLRTVNEINDYGNVTLYYYDGINRQIRQETILTASGAGDGVHIGASIEGIKNDPTVAESSVPTPDSSQGGRDGIIRAGTTFDDNSLMSSRIDDQGNVTLYLYDNLNRQVTETKALIATSALSKAIILGSREIVTPTAATVSNPAVVSTSNIDAQLADARSRLDKIATLFPALADGRSPPTTIVSGYSPDGNLLIREDENDTEVFTKHDAINRPTAVRVFRAGQTDTHAGDPVFAPTPGSDPSNPTGAFPAVVGTTKQDFEYDGLSRMTLARDYNKPDDGTCSSVTYAFDSLSRLIETTQTLDILGYVISMGYRAENLCSNLRYPSARVRYVYDDLDRIDTLALNQGGQDDNLVDYNYIGTHRVLERIFPMNDTRMTYLDDNRLIDVGYDGLRRQTQLRHLRQDNSLIVGFAHDYDRMNNKLNEIKLHNQTNNEIYGYDAHYRLTAFDRSAAEAISPQQSSWDLDGAGNWAAVDGETREYSSVNEVISRAEGGTRVVLAYDDNGNLTDDGTFNFEWDFSNRLRRVTRKSDRQLIAEYSYDAAGRRVQKVVTNSGPLNGTTRYLYDGQRVIEEHERTSPLTERVSRVYVYGNSIDEVLVMHAGDRRLYYHQNTLGSVYALTNSASIVEGYLYDAYGRQTVYHAGANNVVDFGGDDTLAIGGMSNFNNPWLYTGRQFDAESDHYYYRARYFDPRLGRFIGRDPLGIAGCAESNDN